MGKLKYLLNFLGLLLFSFVFCAKTQAAEKVIENLNQSVNISQDSVATITETIDYDFSTDERHGIERYYRLSSKNPDGKFYNLNFELIDITQDNLPATYKHSVSGNSYYIRIGDPDITITGKHRYVITYKMWPVVQKDPDGDYINYNITGNDWKVPILSASAEITLPNGTAPTQTRCFSGGQGSTLQDCTVTSSANVVSVQSNLSLNPGEGLTVNILTPTGGFSNLLTPSDQPLQKKDYSSVWLLGIFFGICILIILIGIIIRLIKMFKKKKAEKAETIIAQYEPPDGMLPAEMGVLEDLKLGMPEITATIIDLAVKGYIKIRRLKETEGFEFIILKENGSQLHEYEQDMLNLFINSATINGKHKVLNIKDLDRTKSSTTIAEVYNKIDQKLRNQKFYSKKISGGAKAGGLVGTIIAFLTMFFIFGFFTLFWLALPIISIIMAVAIARTPGNLTKKGYSQWAKVEGLKLFLTVTEKDRLKFHDAPDKNPELFNKLLPSAIALQVEKEWAKQFEDMDITPSTDWYNDYAPITPIYIASIMSDSFESSLASSFTPPSTSSTGFSSGGFSSGGFSGGGSFGGGGGSDW